MTKINKKYNDGNIVFTIIASFFVHYEAVNRFITAVSFLMHFLLQLSVEYSLLMNENPRSITDYDKLKVNLKLVNKRKTSNFCFWLNGSLNRLWRNILIMTYLIICFTVPYPLHCVWGIWTDFIMKDIKAYIPKS